MEIRFIPTALLSLVPHYVFMISAEQIFRTEYSMLYWYQDYGKLFPNAYCKSVSKKLQEIFVGFAFLFKDRYLQVLFWKLVPFHRFLKHSYKKTCLGIILT